jgi:hypothetical protein
LLKIEIGGIMPTGFKHTAEEAEKLLDNLEDEEKPEV